MQEGNLEYSVWLFVVLTQSLTMWPRLVLNSHSFASAFPMLEVYHMSYQLARRVFHDLQIKNNNLTLKTQGYNTTMVS